MRNGTGSGALDWARKVWDRYASQDAPWAVLTTRDMKVFWKSGEDEIAGLERAGLVARDERVADFGAGMGRLSIPLAKRVREVVAIDVSAEMLDKVRDAARGFENVRTFLLEAGRFPDGRFDTIVSFLVLQHSPPHVASDLLRMMGESLSEGGKLVIDLPIHEWEEPSPGKVSWREIPASELWDSRYYTWREAQELLIAPAGLRVDRLVTGVRDRKTIVLRRAQVDARRLAAVRARALAIEASVASENYLLEFVRPFKRFTDTFSRPERLMLKIRPRAQKLVRALVDLAYPRQGEVRRLEAEAWKAFAESIPPPEPADVRDDAAPAKPISSRASVN